MGYDLHITRKKNWDSFEDERGPEILLDEWVAAVNADPEMRLDGFCEALLPDGRTFRHNNPGIAVWTAWSRNGEGGSNMAWFALSGGNVVVKNPDQEICCKMWRLAQVLKAQVQGDEGEFYDSSGNPTLAASAAES